MDLVGGWDNLWNGITGSSNIGLVMAVVGVALIAFFMLKWLWQKRNGAGGGFPWIGVGLGAVLAGPEWLFPLLLRILQLIINIVVGIVEFAINLA